MLMFHVERGKLEGIIMNVTFTTDDQRVLDRASSIISAKYPTGKQMGRMNSKEYFAMKLGKYDREVFAMISLDSNHKITSYKELFYGTINETQIFIREIAKHALLTNAAFVIIAHNHPNLDTDPSEPDKRLTRILKDTFDIFKITLLDHVIVGGTEPFSFDEHALITGRYPPSHPFNQLHRLRE